LDVEGDIAEAQDGYVSEAGGVLREKRGIEVGNIFQLGHHYTKLMQGAVFVDEDGAEKPYYMGCYGIGIGRTMAAVVEKYHDDKGIKWPKAIAPFQAHLIGLVDANEIYEKLLAAGVEALYDDRNESAGVKFADADLIGIPWRLVVSERTGDKIEMKKRSESEGKLMTVEEVLGTKDEATKIVRLS